MQPIRLHLLGSPRVERAGATLTMDTRKATALLAYLALTGAQSRDALAAFLWPEYDDSRARAALRRTLSTLKAAVGDGVLVATRNTIELEHARIWCDVDLFQELLNGQPAANRLITAVELYRDTFMHGFSLRDSLPFDDWQLLQAQMLGRAFEAALERLIGLLMAAGQDDEALTYALRWLGQDPLREEGHRLVMELYARLGQRSAALRQYRSCVRVLDEELGVAPLEETTRLYHAIQEGAFVPARRPVPPADSAPAPAASPARLLPLVGREAELGQMGKWYGTVGPDGRLLALTGEAGIGKTRLARTFVTQLQAQGTAVLQATCYEGESALAYQLWEQALRSALARSAAAARLQQLAPEWRAEAARLVPELGQATTPPGPLLGNAVARSRFFTGICHTVAALSAGDRPGVLFIDDVQWADEASLDLLAFLVRRLQARPLFVLVTWRDDEQASSARLRQLLTAVRRDGSGRQIALQRLQQDDMARLIAAAGLSDSAGLVQRLSQEAEGLPFMLVEYLAALHQQATADPSGSWTMPVSVRDLLEARLAAVSDIGLQLLQTAAAIGRGFDYDLLLAASGRREEETVAMLEELVGKGLIRENRELPDVPPGYDFSHDKLRALVYEQTSMGRRRLLHRRLAETLAGRARRQPQPGALAAQIGAHFRLAGQDAAAVAYFRQAGDYARTLHAHHEALGHYQAALALGADATAELHAACGDLYTLQGRYTAALASYETAAAVATPDALGELEQKLGQVYLRQGEWALAEQQFAQAQARLGTDAPAVRLAQLNADWSLTAYRQGQQARAAALAEQALALAQTAGDASVLAQAHNMLGILARGAGDHAAAVGHLTRSLALAGQSGRVDAQIAALNNLALAQRAAGQPADARTNVERALALCLTLGDRHREAALRSNLADLQHAAGDDTAAREQVRQSVAIYAEIGREQGSWQSEIWKLIEW